MNDSNCVETRRVKRKNRTETKKYRKGISECSKHKSEYNYQKYILTDRKSYSKTDHGAIFMCIKVDHMKNGKLKA